MAQGIWGMEQASRGHNRKSCPARILPLHGQGCKQGVYNTPGAVESSTGLHESLCLYSKYNWVSVGLTDLHLSQTASSPLCSLRGKPLAERESGSFLSPPVHLALCT